MTDLTKAQTDKAIKAITTENADIAQVLTETFTPDTTSVAPATVKIPVLTEAHLKALKTLPEVFARVTPSEPRMLTEQEQQALVAERDTVDLLLSLLKARKDGSLREHLANHLDRLAEEEGLASEGDVTDKKGHYFVKQDVPVEGTGRKVQRIVSEPKPRIDSAALLRMHEEGDLSREEYLSLTVVPEVSRVFDEPKARKAIKKHPHLLRKIAQATTRPDPTITIKVADDRG